MRTRACPSTRPPPRRGGWSPERGGRVRVGVPCPPAIEPRDTRAAIQHPDGGMGLGRALQSPPRRSGGLLRALRVLGAYRPPSKWPTAGTDVPSSPSVGVPARCDTLVRRSRASAHAQWCSLLVSLRSMDVVHLTSG